MNLKDYFPYVRVINLDRYPDRWDLWKERAAELGVEGFNRFRAIEGDKCPPPDWWRAGAGAWGCLMSHLRLAQDILQEDEPGNLLIFEDDCLLGDDFVERLQLVMTEVGDDWDMLYLGGQHLGHNGKPWRESHLREVIRAVNVNRTHAFAINRRMLKRYVQHIMHASDYIEAPGIWHIDHQLGWLHDPATVGGGGVFRILAVQPWICGQRAGESWISGKSTPEYWWFQNEQDIERGRNIRD